MTDTTTTTDEPTAFLERIRSSPATMTHARELATIALERFAELEATRRILKRILDTLGIHGGFTEDQLIAQVKVRAGLGRLNADELNPNHPVAQLLHDHWHIVAAILLMKLVADERRQELELTDQDIADFREMAGPNGAIIADTRGGRFVLRIVDGAEAAKIAREAGGLPA
jgi:hypothetical protein